MKSRSAEAKWDSLYTVHIVRCDPSEKHPEGGWFVDVSREGFPPHSSEFYASYHEACARFDSMTA